MNAKVSVLILASLGLGTALGWGVAKVNLSPAAKPSDSASAGVDIGSCSASDGDQASPQELFEVNGKTYSETDLPDDLRSNLFDARQQAFERTSAMLEQFALRLALAQKKQSEVNLKELAPLEELLEPKTISDEEIKEVYEASKDRIPDGVTYEQVKPQISHYLQQQAQGKQLQEEIEKLRKSGDLKILAMAPVPPVIDFDLSGFPAKGPESAPITLVEASDYLCPHCQRAQSGVEKILEEYGDKIRFVQVNFALRPNEVSGELARAAHCASQQSDQAFWAFHSSLFKRAEALGHHPSADQGKKLLTDAAKDAELDIQALEKCKDSDAAKSYIQNAIERMSAVGVSGTPAFFLNGRKIHSDHSSLKEAIDSTLKDVM